MRGRHLGALLIASQVWACSGDGPGGVNASAAGSALVISPRPFDQTTNHRGPVEVIVALRDEDADWVDATSIAEHLVSAISLATWPGLEPVPATVSYEPVATSIYSQYEGDLELVITPDSGLDTEQWYVLRVASLPPLREMSWYPHGWAGGGAMGLLARFITGFVMPRIASVEFCPSGEGDTEIGVFFNDLVWTTVAVDQAVHVAAEGDRIACTSLAPAVIGEATPTDRLLLTCAGAITDDARVVVSLEPEAIRAKSGGAFLAAERHEVILGNLGSPVESGECRLFEVDLSP